jgi:NADH-quinone oxidoreductase subunit E
MLTDDERNEIQAAIAEAGTAAGAGLEALKILQRRHGWVSDELLEAAATVLGMSPAELDDVATFFSLIFREPVGRHVILICDSISCYLTGYDALREHLTARLGIGLGETTADGRFTLLPVACLGCCDRAPALMIGEELYTNLTPEKVEEILEGYEHKEA